MIVPNYTDRLPDDSQTTVYMIGFRIIGNRDGAFWT